MTLAGMMLWTCGAIACAVFGVMLHSIATFRRTPEAGPRALRHGRLVEILWAILPILIIAGTAAPAMRGSLRPEAPAVSQEETASRPFP